MLAEKAKEEATPQQQMQKGVKKATNALKVATPTPTPPPPQQQQQRSEAAAPAPAPQSPAPTTPKAQTKGVKTPKTPKSKSGKRGMFGKLFGKKAKKVKTEFDVEVYSANSSQSMPLMLCVNEENVMLRHSQNKMKETFGYGHQLKTCKVDPARQNTLVLVVQRTAKDKRELLLRVKVPAELSQIAQMVDEKKTAYMELHDLSAVAARAGADTPAPAPAPEPEPEPEPEPKPEAKAAPKAPSPPPSPPAAQEAAPKPPSLDVQQSAPPASPPPSAPAPPPPPPSAPTPPPPTPPPPAAAQTSAPAAEVRPEAPAAPEPPAPPPAAAAPKPPAAMPPPPMPEPPSMAPAAAEAPGTPGPPPIPESVMRNLKMNASSSTPAPAPEATMPPMPDALLSPLMAPGGKLTQEGMASELTKARSYAVRMREALFDRDRRLIALEKRLVEESSLRRMRDNECMDMAGKLRAAEEELKVLRQKSRLAHALQLGGPASKELIARHPDVLQRESMRAARVEVVRLEKERDELAFMNGRLILRLNDMQTSVDRIKKALKVEDAASRLNDAYSAADQAQKLVGDTAAMLITDGTLDPNSSPYDRNPLHYRDRVVF